MKQRTLYQVRVTQEIPFCDYDEDGEETRVSSGRIEEYVAGRFSAEHNAKLFAEALENKIAEESGYVTNCFTPKVSIIKITQIWRPGRGYDNCLCMCFHLFSQVRVAVMKLREFLAVFEQSDRLRIVKNEKDVYTGFLALMAHAGNMEALMDAEVKRFRPIPEIRHKEWQKRGLMAPLQPQETPEYSFSDLQMNLYNTIYL